LYPVKFFEALYHWYNIKPRICNRDQRIASSHCTWQISSDAIA